MIRFSRDKVLLLRQLIIAETGGSPDIRDMNLLDSALECVFQTYCSDDDVIDAGLGVASGKMKYDEILARIKEHRI